MQVLDNGSQALSNAEVLAHLNSLGARIEDEARVEEVPDGLKKVLRDVRPTRTSGPPAYSKLTRPPR
jgi:hypothetical protein